MDNELTTYSQFRPTGFDPSGLALDDRQDWLVVPCGRNRDSGALAESNFAAALQMLGGESDTCEVHRFGHWACGWFEIIIVAPARESDAMEIVCALASYPVLDDSDLSERETNDAEESWSSWACSDLIDQLCKTFELRTETRYWLQDDREQALRTLHSDWSNVDYETGSDGPHFDFSWVERDQSFTRDEFAKWIRTVRKAPPETVWPTVE
jgi:hypothetical protein